MSVNAYTCIWEYVLLKILKKIKNNSSVRDNMLSGGDFF